MTNAIDMTTKQRGIILDLLDRHLPGVVVWAYGSRVKRTVRRGSDLDLVAFADADRKKSISALREAFEESNLPFRVDLFVWNEIPETFRRNIQSEHVVLQEKTTSTDNGGRL